MRDVTENIDVRPMPRTPGKTMIDELWHAGKKIGTRTVSGPRFTDPDYEARVTVDGQSKTLKIRIFRK